jgi:hypothetical protein
MSGASGELPGGSYKPAADSLTAAGYPTKEQDFKNALRDKSPLPEHTIPADAPGVRELVGALLSIWPVFEWERLVLDPDRTTCGKPTACRRQIRRKSAETLESFRPRYEISYSRSKPRQAKSGSSSLLLVLPAPPRMESAALLLRALPARQREGYAGVGVGAARRGPRHPGGATNGLDTSLLTSVAMSA